MQFTRSEKSIPKKREYNIVNSIHLHYFSLLRIMFTKFYIDANFYTNVFFLLMKLIVCYRGIICIHLYVCLFDAYLCVLCCRGCAYMIG